MHDRHLFTWHYQTKDPESGSSWYGQDSVLALQSAAKCRRKTGKRDETFDGSAARTLSGHTAGGKTFMQFRSEFNDAH